MTATKSLPNGWEETTLGGLVGEDGLFSDGDWIETNDQDPAGDVRLIQLADIGDGTYRNRSNRFLTSQRAYELECTFLKTGDVLIARLPDPLGRACIFTGDEKPCVTAVDVCIFRSGSKGVDHRWLTATINSPQFRAKIEPLSSGTTRKRISRSNLATIKLPVPPLNEQRRIAAKIEELLGRAGACRKRLDGIPRLLEQFRQAVLDAASSGRLTSGWRTTSTSAAPATDILDSILRAHEEAGGHKRGNAAPPTEDVHTLTKETFPEGWELTDLRTLCEPDRPITYGILMPGPNVPDGVPYVRVADFPNDRLSTSTIRRTTAEIDAQYARARLRAGDILLSIRGTVGRVCIIPKELEGANITQDTARLTIQKEVDSRFVAWVLRAPSTQRRMQKAIKGVAVRGINIGDVRALQIPIPSPDEQREIVRRVEGLLKVADTVEEHYRLAQKQLDKLPQSILAKAFRGELVPQDPDDEPASELLERIKTESARQRTASQKKIARSNKPKEKGESATPSMFAR